MLKIVITNCDDKEVEYEYSSVKEFMYTMENDIGINIPMLDDRIKTVKIDGKIKHFSNVEIVDDLYCLFY